MPDQDLLNILFQQREKLVEQIADSTTLVDSCRKAVEKAESKLDKAKMEEKSAAQADADANSRRETIRKHIGTLPSNERTRVLNDMLDELIAVQKETYAKHQEAQRVVKAAKTELEGTKTKLSGAEQKLQVLDKNLNDLDGHIKKAGGN